jgi:hypothetical protein
LRGQYAWLERAVRHVRKLGLASVRSRSEYVAALVAALARHASFPADYEEPRNVGHVDGRQRKALNAIDEQRRRRALVLADRLASRLKGSR